MTDEPVTESRSLVKCANCGTEREMHVLPTLSCPWTRFTVWQVAR